MTLTDWINALPYSNHSYIDDLINLLDKIGIKLNSD